MNRITSTKPSRPPLRRSPRPQQGTAYLLTLIALVVLTTVGLSLSLITQTERQLGVNERLAQRVFYAANSGTAAATARVLAQNNANAMTLIHNRSDGPGNTEYAERERTSRFHPILASPCNFCEINQGSQFYDVNHAVTATAERIGWSGGGQPPADAPAFARKTVTTMVALQPWQVNLQEGLLPSLEEGELEEIRF